MSTQNIQVFVRIRPLSERDRLCKLTSRCITCLSDTSLEVSSFESISNAPALAFTFDHVFPEETNQMEVYRTVASKIVESAFQGVNGTIFCYGQTASGKTYTCVGESAEQRGILPRLLEDILGRIAEMPKSQDVRLKLEIVEIYNQSVRDLLDPIRTNLKIRENRTGVFIDGVSFHYISHNSEANILLNRAKHNRAVGTTQMNLFSSRSHVLFLLTIVRQDFTEIISKVSKVTLIDLAGSEKASKTGSEGKQLQEAIKINTSLSALGNVIYALSEGRKKHVPYRDSKLTRLLQESLGGNAVTSLIINVSSSLLNEIETVTSLRFGHRAKAVRNQPRVNRHYTNEQLLGLLEKAEVKLKAQAKIIAKIRGDPKNNGEFEKEFTLYLLNSDDQESNASSMPRNTFPRKQQSMTHLHARPRQLTFDKQSNSCVKSMKVFDNTSVKERDQYDKPKSVLSKMIEENFDDEEGNEQLNGNQWKQDFPPFPPTFPQGFPPIFPQKIKAVPKTEQGRNLARTKSQNTFEGEQLLKANEILREECETLKRDYKTLKDHFQRIMQNYELLKKDNQHKRQALVRKNDLIEKLKEKNCLRKQEIEKEITNLKNFWVNYNISTVRVESNSPQPV